MIRLGERLGAILSLASGNLVCDIGCDHGYLSIALITEGKAAHVIASDLREGPLSRARINIEKAGLVSDIETVCADGISHLKGRGADCIVIAGMGGPLIEGIIKRDEETARAARLILSPQSHVPEFRAFLWDRGYEIKRELLVLEEGKYYPIMEVLYKESPVSYSKRDFFLGKDADLRMDEVLSSYIDKRCAGLKAILNSVPEGERREEIISELSAIKGGNDDGKGNI